MKKILVVNVNWLGDVVFSTPVFRALKEKYPDATLTCLVVPRVVNVAQQIPFIDEILVYDEKGCDRFLWGKLKLVFRLRSKGFDAAFLLHGSWTRALLVFLAGIPMRVGYDIKKRGWLLTHRVSVDKGLVHRSDFYLKILEPLGIVTKDRKTFLEVDEEAMTCAQNLLSGLGIKEGDFCVVAHIGGNWNLKRWPLENFAKLFDILAEDFKAKVIVCGGKNDVVLAQKVSVLTRYKPYLLAGKTTFQELAALMKKASVVVSADSGPLHIASSVGTPVVGLFGPTHPLVTGPRGSGKSLLIHHDVGCNINPCYYLNCSDSICMKAISVDNVIQKIREIQY
ncbi:MAG: lipopolysaccharide heptosyltransferase II [Candidatus Omnitrophota bacterium]